MKELFVFLLNKSLTTSYLILAVLVLRLLFRKLPKAPQCLLWAVVAVRLVLPISPESALSLLPRQAPVSAVQAAYSAAAVRPQSVAQPQQGAVPMLTPVQTEASVSALPPEGQLLSVLTVVWLAGVTLMLLCSLVSYLKLKKRLQISLRVKDNIYLCDDISDPFVLGVWKPRIYLPSTMDYKQYPYILAHERAHLRRKDAWWKLLGYGILCVYWFHPLVWVSYWLFCRDLEMACDEQAVRGMDAQSISNYADALLRCASSHHRLGACPVAFGENGIKTRIRNLFRKKTTKIWILVLSVLLAGVLCWCCFASPKQSEENPLPDGFLLEQTGTNQYVITHDGAQIGGLTTSVLLGQESFEEIWRLLGIDIYIAEYIGGGDNWSVRPVDGEECSHNLIRSDTALYDLWLLSDWYHSNGNSQYQLAGFFRTYLEEHPEALKPEMVENRQEDAAALEFFRKYLQQLASGTVESWAKMVYFPNEACRVEAIENWQRYTIELQQWERVNENLWAFTLPHPSEDAEIYMFVANMDGNKQIIRNVKEIPESLQENLRAYRYTLDEEKFYYRDLDLTQIYYDLRQFADPVSIECYSLEDTGTLSWLDFQGSTDVWTMEQSLPDVTLPESIDVGCVMTSNEGNVLVIQDGLDYMDIFLEDGSHYMRVYGFTCGEILDYISAWALSHPQSIIKTQTE